MHAITPRNSTPSQSPHHSPSHHSPHTNPVPIPASHKTESHHANALRYKHLYGFARTPRSPSEDSVVQGSSTTDGSDAEYIEFVVENPEASGGSSISSDSTTRTRTTDTSSLAADHAHLVSSASPTAWLTSSSFAASVSSPSTSTSGAALFTLSGAGAQGRSGDGDSVGSDQVVFDQNVARVGGDDHLASETPSDDGVCTPRQETSNHYRDTNQVLSPHTRTIPRGISSTRTPHTPTLRPASPETDEFRCTTCRHAGLCADLVTHDPTFRCGDTMTTTSVATVRERRGERALSARAVEKTPWTGRRIRDVVESVTPDDVGERLRVLERGVDYVRYDDGSDGEKRRVADIEDLGRAMEGTSLASPAYQNNDSSNPKTVRSSSSTRNPPRPPLSSTLSGRVQRRSWNDVQVEYSASLLETDNAHTDALPAETRSTETTSVESSDEAVTPPPVPHLAPVVGVDGNPATDVPPEISTTPRSRSKVKHIWTLRHPDVRVLGAGDGEEEVDESGRYDQDDERYGVDVVERGRRRFR